MKIKNTKYKIHTQDGDGKTKRGEKRREGGGRPWKPERFWPLAVLGWLSSG